MSGFWRLMSKVRVLAASVPGLLSVHRRWLLPVCSRGGKGEGALWGPFGVPFIRALIPFMGPSQVAPLEKEMASHSSILAWETPWTEEPGGLQSLGLQRVGHD